MNFTLFDAKYFRISIDTQALFWDAVKVFGKSLILLGLAFKNLVGAEQHLASGSLFHTSDWRRPGSTLPSDHELQCFPALLWWWALFPLIFSDTAFPSLSLFTCMCLSVCCQILEGPSTDLRNSLSFVYVILQTLDAVVSHTLSWGLSRALCTQGVHWVPPGLLVPTHGLETLTAMSWGDCRAGLVYVPPVRIAVLYHLVSRALKTVWCILFGFYDGFRWNDKSGLYFFSSIGSRTCRWTSLYFF